MRKSLLLLMEEGEAASELVEELTALGFHVTHVTTTAQALEVAHALYQPAPSTEFLDVVVAKLGTQREAQGLDLISEASKLDARTFQVVYSWTATNNAKVRWNCFEEGAHMVTSDERTLFQVLKSIANSGLTTGGVTTYVCPYCDMTNLTEDEMVVHMTRYHSKEPSAETRPCPICLKNSRSPMLVHVRNSHGPVARGEMPKEETHLESFVSFALVVVRRPSDGKFLVVQEFCQVGYWLPGGRVDSGETFQEAAIRETKEEGGVDVDLDGILSVEFTPSRGGRGHVRMRVIFLAHPVHEGQPMKTEPDYESLGACWVSAEEVKTLELRGSEPLVWFNAVAAGAEVHSMSLLTDEHTFYRDFPLT